MAKVRGAIAIDRAMTSAEESTPLTTKETLAESTIGILQGQARRINKQEILLESMTDLLMQRIATQPEKFKNDFLRDTIQVLSDSVNSTASTIVKALTPQKEGDGLIQLIFNSDPQEGNSVSYNGQQANLPDGMTLKTVNIAHQAACIVVQEDAKERQRQEVMDLTSMVDVDYVMDNERQ